MITQHGIGITSQCFKNSYNAYKHEKDAAYDAHTNTIVVFFMLLQLLYRFLHN